MKWLLRILGTIAVLIVLAVAVLFVLGMRPDNYRLQASVTVKRPPAEVWPWLYEGDKLKQWISWLKDVKGDSGPPVAGSHVAWVMEDANNGGRQMTIDATVQRAEPQRLLAVHVSTMGAFEGDASYTLTDLGGGSTRIDSDARYRFDNGFARLMSPLIMASAKKKMEGDMERLRSAIEKQPATTTASGATK